jgi:SAM-dependent methyltransferase
MTGSNYGHCIACGSANTQQLVDIADIPVYTNVPQPDRESALNVSMGDISLIFCRDCSHLCNQDFDPALIEYAPGYEAALDFSPKFREYADALAQSLIDRFDLHEKKVIEVACGRGDFLQRLCTLGPNNGVGFDPSYVGADTSDDGRIEYVRDYYSESYSHYTADFLCCRHALEHIPQPGAFVENLRKALAASAGAHVFIEVPNSLYTLKDLGIWDLIYEHCSYFSSGSLGQILTSSGMQVIDVEDGFGGQFLGAVAKPLADATIAADRQFTVPDITEYAGAFADSFSAKVDEWSTRLGQLASEGKRVVVWGAGSKAVTFLNILKTKDLVEKVIDINPRKTGLYVPGTGQQIVEPSALSDYQPDTVIIMNPIYRDEIAQMLLDMGVYADILEA